jgi:hypothetical protein
MRAPRATVRERAAWLRRRLWNPPAHWRLLAFCMAVVVVVVAFEGIATHTIGTSAEPTDVTASSAPLLHIRPILSARGHRLVSEQPAPGRRVALT